MNYSPVPIDFDMIASNFGLVRSPGELDAELCNRILLYMQYPPHGIPTITLHLWLLLAKLGIQSVPRQYFPVGITI